MPCHERMLLPCESLYPFQGVRALANRGMTPLYGLGILLEGFLLPFQGLALLLERLASLFEDFSLTDGEAFVTAGEHARSVDVGCRAADSGRWFAHMDREDLRPESVLRIYGLGIPQLVLSRPPLRALPRSADSMSPSIGVWIFPRVASRSPVSALDPAVGVTGTVARSRCTCSGVIGPHVALDGSSVRIHFPLMWIICLAHWNLGASHESRCIGSWTHCLRQSGYGSV